MSAKLRLTIIASASAAASPSANPRPARLGYLVDVEERRIDSVEPGTEARQLTVDDLGGDVAALDVDEDPGLHSGRAQGGGDAENARVGYKPLRQRTLVIAELYGGMVTVFQGDPRARELLRGEPRADHALAQRAQASSAARGNAATENAT